jgi:energy-coupling factor transporter ATP-binding protein EcfA2
VTIMGQNGAGKSSIIKMLNGMLLVRFNYVTVYLSNCLSKVLSDSSLCDCLSARVCFSGWLAGWRAACLLVFNMLMCVYVCGWMSVHVNVYVRAYLYVLVHIQFKVHFY